MGAAFCDISMSLDGFIAGPDPGPEHPLGKGGERLHDWAYALASFNESHGRTGGVTNADDAVVAESLARQGAVVMGRNMFGGGTGPWGDDPWEGWWGDEPPFRLPVFVLTHHARDTLTKGATTFTFVTEGIEAAVEQARSVAGEKDVWVAGGAAAIQQAMRAELIDEIQIHVAPLMLGAGVRLLDRLDDVQVELEKMRVLDSPGVTHMAFRVVR